MRHPRLKQVALIVAGQSPASEDVTDLDGGLPFMQGNAEFGPVYPCPIHQCDEPPKRAKRGDFLISVRAPVGALNVADQNYGIGRGLAAIRPLSIDGGYLKWLLSHSVAELRSVATGSTFEAVSASDLGDLRVAQVDREDQRAIAEFLDRETAQIDAMIEAQRELVSGLKERRVSAVTQLIEAAGAMTEGKRLKHHLSSVRQGWSPQCHPYPRSDESEWAVLRAGCVNGGRFNADDNKVLPDDLEPRSNTVVQCGDLVVSRANTRELVGSAAIVTQDYPRLMLSDKLYALALHDDVNPDYVAAVLAGPRHRGLIELAATGASYSMQNISQADIVNLPMDLPSRSDQDAAMAAAQATTDRMDAMIDAATDSIALMQERRAALISAAVTGRIDPRTGEEPEVAA